MCTRPMLDSLWLLCSRLMSWVEFLSRSRPGPCMIADCWLIIGNKLGRRQCASSKELCTDSNSVSESMLPGASAMVFQVQKVCCYLTQPVNGFINIFSLLDIRSWLCVLLLHLSHVLCLKFLNPIWPDSVYCSAAEQISYCGLLKTGDAFPLWEGVEEKKKQQQKEGGRGLSARCVVLVCECIYMYMCIGKVLCKGEFTQRGGLGSPAPRARHVPWMPTLEFHTRGQDLYFQSHLKPFPKTHMLSHPWYSADQGNEIAFVREVSTHMLRWFKRNLLPATYFPQIIFTKTGPSDKSSYKSPHAWSKVHFRFKKKKEKKPK